jgi:hypothetical protein
MSALPTKKDIERAERVKKWAERLGIASMAIPSPLGDVVGFGADMVNPENRTPAGVGLGLAGLLPGVPNVSGLKKLDDLFDARHGVGAVPDNEDVERLGAVHYMRPSEFLDKAEPLTCPSNKSLDHIKGELAKGKKLGQPRLSVDVVGNKPTVVNHDGRHRMMVIKEMYGDDVLVPVHVKGNGPYRALPKHVPPSAYMPQRETDAQLAEALKRADILLQRHKDKL